MDAKELLLIQINQTIHPPDPNPIFTAEIEYPPECWYRLKNETERTPEDLADFIAANLTPEAQIATMSGLDRARMDVTSTCGLTLVMLFSRNFEGKLTLDDVQFMDSVQLAAFKMNNGKSKDSFSSMTQSNSTQEDISYT
jgi:hypothetical protein